MVQKYINQIIKKSEKFSKDNLKVIRPAYGLHPKYFDHVIGKISKKNIHVETPLKKDFFSGDFNNEKS
jgi:sialic acid synthase SpsE